MLHKEFLTREQVELLESEQCKITFQIRKAEGEAFDYLLIRNDVDGLAHNLFDWEKQNETIRARLEDPIDYADGHMSLLAISQYIEGLWPETLGGKIKFQYVEKEAGSYELAFETWLPIIRKKRSG